MKVTVCQLDVRDHARRTAALAALTAHVQHADPELVLLPELPFGAWLPAELPTDGERWSEVVEAHDMAIDRLGAYGDRAVIGTRPTVEPDGTYRNRAFVWTAEAGAVAVHDKYYLPDEPGFWEASWYDRGERRFDDFEAAGARVGVQICTELWFSEWARRYGAAGVELLCVPRATPSGSTGQWKAAGQVAAVAAGAFCVSSNQWTPAGTESDFGGVGWIIDPNGVVLALTSEADPFLTVDVDLAASRAAKSTYPRYVTE